MGTNERRNCLEISCVNGMDVRMIRVREDKKVKIIKLTLCVNFK